MIIQNCNSLTVYCNNPLLSTNETKTTYKLETVNQIDLLKDY